MNQLRTGACGEREEAEGAGKNTSVKARNLAADVNCLKEVMKKRALFLKVFGGKTPSFKLQ